jgi:anaerobic dimethyl sulfoxide reductase subunit A
VDGGVVRMTGEPAAVRRHHLEPCVRGLRYEARVHHPDRLLRPLMRRGPRGSGQFREVSWDEALAYVADRLGEIRAESGPTAFLCHGRSGSFTACFHETRLVSQRFFNLFGGHLGTTGNYSNAAATPATLHTYGTLQTGHSRSDWLRSRLLLLWGWDPLVTVMGSHTARALRECRRRGTPIVVVDPRRSATAAFADRWVPIRPGTDVALLNALAYELVVHGWHDQRFLARHAVGFEAYRDYLLGVEDGVPKTGWPPSTPPVGRPPCCPAGDRSVAARASSSTGRPRPWPRLPATWGSLGGARPDSTAARDPSPRLSSPCRPTPAPRPSPSTAGSTAS